MQPSPRGRRPTDVPSVSELKSILVVEDDDDLCAVLRLALEDEGYAVESDGGGLAALREVRRARPDLVVLDPKMSRMGGADFLYACARGSRRPGCPSSSSPRHPR